MIPSIALVYSVEMIRDGGALAAIFQGANGSEYWLFFRLRHRTLTSGMFERLGYERPLALERQTNNKPCLAARYTRFNLRPIISAIQPASTGWAKRSVPPRQPIAGREFVTPTCAQRI